MATEPFPATAASPIRERDPEKRLSGGLTRSQTLSSNRHDHPYLIRTTSSSLLTRSNSVGSTHKPQHLAAVTPPSPALGRSQGRGHKHSKSQTYVPPPPLPVPMALASPDRAEQHPLNPSPTKETPRRLRRSETLPSVQQPKTPEKPLAVEDLPSNPKVWTSSHLALYLSSALRLKSGGSLPVPVIRDIATFVVNQKLNGRVFLRLTPHDLEDMGMNQLWRPALLSASRALRQNVVQGRIWGFGQTGEEAPSSPTPTAAPSSVTTKHASLPSVPTTVFEDYLDELAERGAESSGPEDRHEAAGWIARAMMTSSGSSGRVKGMVASFERAASGGSGMSDHSADEGATSQSPFDFDSPAAEAETMMSPVPALSVLTEEPAAAIDLPITVEPPTDVESEVTSGSEAGDEDEGLEEGNVTISGQAGLREADLELVKGDVESDDCSPTSSVLPQTPPPTYAPSELTPGNAIPESDDASLRMPLPPSPLHGRSPSSTIMLTTGRLKPGYVAHIVPDSGSDDTIENLIANFNSEDNPLTASWGANAWLESQPDGATARKIHDPIAGTVSISRSRGSRIASGRRSGHEPKRPSLTGLFDDASIVSSIPSAANSTSDVAVDATVDIASVSEPSLVDSQIVAELKEKQAKQEVLLEEFRARLEEVERKLEQMEEKDAARDAELAAAIAAARPVSPTKVHRAVSPTPQTGDSDEPTTPLEEEESNVPQSTIDPAASDDNWQDPAFGELPSYVFMIGLGVCAIAMRVMIKKVVGKKTNLLSF